MALKALVVGVFLAATIATRAQLCVAKHSTAEQSTAKSTPDRGWQSVSAPTPILHNNFNTGGIIMAYAKLSSNPPISAGLHRAYLRDRKQFVKPAYALPFNDDEYQQGLEPQDYLASIKNALSFAWRNAVNLWDRAGQW